MSEAKRPRRKSPAKTTAGRRAVDRKQFIELLRKHHGNASSIAKALGVTRQAIQSRIKNNDEFAEVASEARESAVDIAESQLIQAVQRGSGWAIKFLLATWGRHRGFTTKVEVSGSVDQSGKVVLVLPDDGRGGGGAG